MKKISVMFSALLLLCSMAQAQLKQQLVSERGGEMVVKNELLNYRVDSLMVNGQLNFKISFPQGSYNNAPGLPDLPGYNRSIIIPDNQDLEVEVVKSEYRDIPVGQLLPSRGVIYKNQDPSTIPYNYASLYQEDRWYPEQTSTLGEPFIYRDLRGALLQVTPFQYNPSKKILRVYSNITVKLKPSGLAKINPLVRSRALEGVDPEFEAIYQRTFLNYQPERYPQVNEEGSLLIISHASFMNAMQPFVEWKKQKGMKVEMVDVAKAGTTISALKTYVANYYKNSANKLKYLLLVGDADKVPTDNIPLPYINPANAGSDIKIGEISGTDCYSEIFIGRFSGKTEAEIKTQVNKSIYYESKMKTTDTWLANMIGSASVPLSSDPKNKWGETDLDFMNNIYAMVQKEGKHKFTRLNQNGAGGTGCQLGNPTSVSKAINEGLSAYAYSNHGNRTSYPAVSMDTYYASKLQNVNKYFYTYAVACNPGEFNTQTSDCFAEALMKAQYNGAPAGAIGCFMSTISQPWNPPYAGVREITSILMQEDQTKFKRTMGGTMLSGAMRAYEDCPNEGGRETVEAWTLFGDPSLQIYTNTPQETTIKHNSEVKDTDKSIQISGTNGTQVALYNASKNFQTTGTIQNGQLSLPVDLSNLTDLPLTITGTRFNGETYIGTLKVLKGSAIGVVKSLGETTLYENYPNPFNPQTAISFNLKRAGEVKLEIFNSKGENVETLFQGQLPAGEHSFNFNGANLQSGVYLYRLSEGSSTLSGKMLLLK